MTRLLFAAVLRECLRVSQQCRHRSYHHQEVACGNVEGKDYASKLGG